jgi:hypothetical protein
LLDRQASFCGVQTITKSVLANHIHLEVRLPEPRDIPDQELLARAQAFYDPKSSYLKALQLAWDPQRGLPADLRQALRRRMGDVSVFMKELKQAFTRWYNRQHERFGTLWAERFKSLLLEDQPDAVGTVAAYIDLNAVRAHLVPDPKDYPFCGYAEAVAGKVSARQGLMTFLQAEDWEHAAKEYRMRLFVEAGSAGHSDKAILDRETILKVLDQGGRLAPAQALRLRIRYFKDGLVLGSESFVAAIFEKFRSHFGSRRKSGPRKLRKLPFTQLRTLRDLRLNVLG